MSLPIANDDAGAVNTLPAADDAFSRVAQRVLLHVALYPKYYAALMVFVAVMVLTGGTNVFVPPLQSAASGGRAATVPTVERSGAEDTLLVPLPSSPAEGTFDPTPTRPDVSAEPPATFDDSLPPGDDDFGDNAEDADDGFDGTEDDFDQPAECNPLVPLPEAPAPAPAPGDVVAPAADALSAGQDAAEGAAGQPAPADVGQTARDATCAGDDDPAPIPPGSTQESPAGDTALTDLVRRAINALRPFWI